MNKRSYTEMLRTERFSLPAFGHSVRHDSGEYARMREAVKNATVCYLMQDGPQLARVLRTHAWNEFCVTGQGSIFNYCFDFKTYDGINATSLAELYKQLLSTDPPKFKRETVVYLPCHNDKVLRNFLSGLVR